MMYSDAFLRRFLEGQLSAEEAKVIEQALEDDPALAQRMMALDDLADPIRAAFDGVPGDTRLAPFAAEIRAQAQKVDTHRAATAPANRSGAPWSALVASLALAALAFGWAVWPAPSDWRVEVARYQALYVPQTVAHLDASPEVIAAQLQRAEATMGVALPHAQLASLEGFEFKRAQVLGFEGQPLIQLVYLDATGAPIALCFMKGDDGTKGPAEMAGLASYSWADAGHQYLLIGGTDQDRLDAMAKQIMSLSIGGISQG